mgnify:CR=1 FL=1
MDTAANDTSTHPTFTARTDRAFHDHHEIRGYEQCVPAGGRVWRTVSVEGSSVELCHRAVRMLFVRSILPSHSVRAALYCAAAASAPKIRLHTVTPLYEAAQLVLPDKQRHYLSSVMRLKPGDTVALFNGADGEWSAAVDRLDKRQGVLCVRSLLRPQPTDTSAAPVLAFALIKNARLPTLIEKATELGAADLKGIKMA